LHNCRLLLEHVTQLSRQALHNDAIDNARLHNVLWE
jgi:hypothetical protein